MFVSVGLAFILFGVLLFAFAARITVSRPQCRRYVRVLGGVFVAVGALGVLSVLTGIVTLSLH